MVWSPENYNLDIFLNLAFWVINTNLVRKTSHAHSYICKNLPYDLISFAYSVWYCIERIGEIQKHGQRSKSCRNWRGLLGRKVTQEYIQLAKNDSDFSLVYVCDLDEKNLGYCKDVLRIGREKLSSDLKLFWNLQTLMPFIYVLQMKHTTKSDYMLWIKVRMSC